MEKLFLLLMTKIDLIGEAGPEELKTLTNIIYMIKNNINGKAYIGQTSLTFYKRYNANWVLRADNLHLKSSVKKYGAENFSIFILSHSAPNIDELNRRESDAIKAYSSLEPYGYNMTEGGKNKKATIETRDRASKRLRNVDVFKFRDPEGQVHEVENISRFCQENNLNRRMMTRLHFGKFNCESYKGWTNANNPPIKEHILLSPNGILHTVKNKGLTKFAQSNGLAPIGIISIARGTQYMYQGWTLAGAVDPQKTLEICSPSGELFLLKQREKKAFCIRHGINHGNLNYMLAGNYKEVKGWHLPGVTFEIRSYQSPTGELHIVSMGNKGFSRFCAQYNLNRSNMTQLWKGNIRICQGWKKHEKNL